MTTNTRRVFARISNPKIIAAAIVVLAVTATAWAGLIHIPGVSANHTSPMVATMKPLTPDTIAPLEALNRATVALAQHVMPTVVEIQVEGRQKRPGMQMAAPQQIPEPFRQFFFFGGNGQMQSPPAAQPFRALGSGVIVSPDGYIVTNNHVVKGANKIQVVLHDQKTYSARVVGTDAATDLAVVKIDATGLTSAAFGDSSQLQPGQTVFAIGAPLGQGFSITSGLISALNRQRDGGPDMRGNFIQTDSNINHGNSGGPLVNIDGQVIGINTEMLTSQEGYANIGFAIPSNLVKSVASDLITSGKVVRGYLGIDVMPLTPNIAASLNESNASGVVVAQVNPGSPAATAGLKPYDVVTKFNGSRIENGGDLQVVAGAAAPGARATVNVLRDGKPMTFTVTMGNFTSAPGTNAAVATNTNSAGTPTLGATVAPLTPELRSQLQLPGSVNGLVVESVTPEGPAATAGLTRGDIIEQANRKPVTSVAGLEKQIASTPAGRDLLLMVERNGSDFILPITPQR
ncbi:MAG: Do family serine endopeptidase [Terriglobales bacterium]